LRLKITEYSIVYTLGALFYCIIEILWRGYSHWSMTVTGGVCLAIIYCVNDHLERCSVWSKSIISAFAVTAVEFAVGCIVNISLEWNVWDYSDRPISLLGQICPEYFVLWYLLCIPATLLSEQIRNNLFCGQNKAA